MAAANATKISWRLREWRQPPNQTPPVVHVTLGGTHRLWGGGQRRPLTRVLLVLSALRGVRGSLQHRVLPGPGEELRPPAGHRGRGLQGQPVGCEQGQLHHGASPHTCHPVNTLYTALCLHVLYCVCLCVSQSLTGHKNPVQCVQFNSAEDQIVAGSQSGSIRVWDMEAAKSE